MGMTGGAFSTPLIAWIDKITAAGVAVKGATITFPSAETRTLTAATTTTATVGTAAWPTALNGLKGWRIRFTSGTYSGQSRLITLNTATVITFAPALAGSPGADTFTIEYTFGKGDGSSTVVEASDWGSSQAIKNLLKQLVGDGTTANLPLGDSAITNAVIQSFITLLANQTYTGNYKSDFAIGLSALDNACKAIVPAQTAVTDLITFLRWINFGAGVGSTGAPSTTYARLVPPDFATLYLYAKNSAIDPKVVYSPIVGVANTPSDAGLGKITSAATDTLVDGTAIDTTQYAGAARLLVDVTGWSAGSAVLTVNGIGRDNLGNTVGSLGTPRTWTSASIGANGTYTLTPTVVGDILTSVNPASATPKGLTLAKTGLNNGCVFNVRCDIPVDRSNPPI